MKKEYAYQSNHIMAQHCGKTNEIIDKADRSGEIIEITCIRNNGKQAQTWKFWNQSEMTTDKWIFLGLLLGNLPGFLLKITQIFLIDQIDSIFSRMKIVEITTLVFARGISVGLIFYFVIPLAFAYFIGPDTISKIKYTSKWTVQFGKIGYFLAWILLLIITIINASIDISLLGKTI